MTTPPFGSLPSTMQNRVPLVATPTPNGFLQRLARASNQSLLEKDKINNSLGFIQRRLTNDPDLDIKKPLVFGSHSRGTLLPRKFDPQSDVDLMIEFRNSEFKPQTYLDQLRRFVERTYKSSMIRQSHPTIQLELNHIIFELVPAIRNNWFDVLYIPNRRDEYLTWQETQPIEFNFRLTDKNRQHNSLIKPLIRVMKCWNAYQGYVFESFELEQKVVDHWYLLVSPRLFDYLDDFVTSLDIYESGVQWKADKLSRLLHSVSCAKRDWTQGDGVKAVSQLSKVFPSQA